MNKIQEYKIGDRIVDYNEDGSLKRDMTLTAEEIQIQQTNTENPYTYKIKFFHFICNKCGWKNGIIRETSIKKGRGCRCCTNYVVVKGINDIATTHPHLTKYFYDIEDAYKTTHGSQKKLLFKCPNCGFVKESQVHQIVESGFSCPRCSDGLSYPEKFFASFLSQLNIPFKTQLGNSTFDWCGKYKYDFYIPEFNCIIETHGKQHYEETLWGCKNLKAEQLNDLKKMKIAIKNGIKYYIVLDCRHSDPKWIQQSIKESALKELINISNIDWQLCDKYAVKSLVFDVCKAWASGRYPTTNDLTKDYPVCRNTIVAYLKQGTALGWCEYNPNEELRKSTSKNGKALGKPINVYINNQLICTANSAQELSRNSENIFGRKIFQSDISKICNGTKKQLPNIFLEYK